MKGQTDGPRTPPATRVRPVATLPPPSPAGLRSRSTFGEPSTPPIVTGCEGDDDTVASEEESPIKNRQASQWWTRQARRSVSDDSSSARPALSRHGSGKGVVLTRGIKHDTHMTKRLSPRKTRFDDSPASIKSSSSSVSSRYVPPHLRSHRAEEDVVESNRYLPSLGKNNFAAFDRSSAPEPEDSFYTFSNEPSFAFSHFSAHTSTPNSSRDLSRGFGLSPTFPRTSKAFNASPSPRPLLRSIRLGTPASGHPQAIFEEDEASPDADGAAIDHFEFDRDEEPLGPVLPLASIHDEGSSVDLSQLETVDTSISSGDCSGCGLTWDRSFVVFLPCRHSCCPDCLNSMVNGAAHKPPRPTDCFACSHRVEGFDPCCPDHYSSRGGPGIARVLAATLQEEGHKMRTAARRSPNATISRPTTEEDFEEDERRRMSRTGRRRSSVVAAAITATLLSRPKPLGSLSRQTSPTHLRTTFTPPTSTALQKLDHDTLASLSRDGGRDALALPSAGPNALEAVSSSSQWSEQTQGILTPLLDWASEPMPASEAYFPGSISTRSSRSSYDSSLDGVSIRSSLESMPPRRTEWPVVRLDNLPWSVTADEVEHWLPDGSLASDVGCSPELFENGQVLERVALAVHILCNRVDGRTLNQAFVECSSLEAAKAIVRLRDGTRLRGRPLHVAMSTQSELLTTIFPTYTFGFEGLDALPNAQAPCALVHESELRGLLELCRLESPHAFKAPERPYYNLVSIIEKLPFHQVEAYTSGQIANLFEASVSTVKTLRDMKDHVVEWREILTVLIDAILRCPAFFPSQKKKVVKLAGGLGFVQNVPSKTIDVFCDNSSSSRVSSLAAIAFPAIPSQSADRLICTSIHDQISPSVRRDDLLDDTSPSPSPGLRSASASDTFLSMVHASQHRTSIEPRTCSRVPSPSYVFPPTPSPRLAPFPSSSNPDESPHVHSSSPRQRRRSSIARRLNIDIGLVAAVAKELGIVLA